MENAHENLKLIRIKKGLSAKELAEKVGLTISGYSSIERGISDISLKRLKQFSEALDVSPLEILGFNIKESQNFQNQYYERRIKELEEDLKNCYEKYGRMMEGYFNTVRFLLLSKRSSQKLINEKLIKTIGQIEEKNKININELAYSLIQEFKDILFYLFSKNRISNERDYIFVNAFLGDLTHHIIKLTDTYYKDSPDTIKILFKTSKEINEIIENQNK